MDLVNPDSDPDPQHLYIHKNLYVKIEKSLISTSIAVYKRNQLFENTVAGQTGEITCS